MSLEGHSPKHSSLCFVHQCNMNFGKKTSLGANSTFTSGEELYDESEDDYQTTGKGKRKSRNLSEKKRRDQFNLLISELFTMVSSSERKMDKSAVLKATIAYIKLHNDIAMESQAHEIEENWKPSFLTNDEFIQIMLDATHGFLMVFNVTGKIAYISDNVKPILGYFPYELHNHSIFDFIHKEDRIDVYNRLARHRMNLTSNNGKDNQLYLQFHMKTMNSNEKGAFQKVESQGCLKNCGDSDSVYTKEVNKDEYFCCILRLNNAPLLREIHTPDNSMREFISRHSIEWKFLFLDHRAAPIIGFQPFEVLGTSGYDYCHPDDLNKLTECHKQLAQSGEGVSCYYRFLTKGQQWLWLCTYYYISYHQWNSKPELIVCTNTVIDYATVKLHESKEESIYKIKTSQMKNNEVETLDTNEALTSQDGNGRKKKNHSLVIGAAENQEILHLASQYADVESTTDIPPVTSTARVPLTLASFNMTPTQLALFHQLHEKQQKLQEVIISQQQELQSITQKLILTQQMIPIQSPAEAVTETDSSNTNPIFKVPTSS
ncbi:circadian locomoter output cycles protein kaput-like isoform X2 [Tubulanus polymorphus]|uniref:circadian locomoter output cycles protein kaput-like isoform X2 n=1 Tax=Tubulanus polymorphus TaxID=672921 RepID=UPI003DA4FD84